MWPPGAPCSGEPCCSPQLLNVSLSQPLPAAAIAAYRRCLSGQVVWILGNSISRHWAFVLQALLASPPGQSVSPHQFSRATNRDEEKRLCGRGGAWQGARPDNGGTTAGKGNNAAGGCFGLCDCEFSRAQAALGGRSKLLFGWVFEWASPLLEASLLHGTNSSAPPDVVVYNVGWGTHNASGRPDARVKSAGLANMTRRVLDARPGLAFYWRSTTPTCHAGGDQATGYNAAIDQQLCKVPRVRKLDGEAWAHGHCAEYDAGDPVHHSRLAWRHVLTWLDAHCAGITSRPSGAGSSPGAGARRRF